MNSNEHDRFKLEDFRDYLTVLARTQIPVSMQARLDASDIVQDTLLEAHRKFDQFRGGQNSRAFAAWLRKLLACNLIDALRGQRCQSRDVRREKSMQASLDQSASGFFMMIPSDQSTPSQIFDRQQQSAWIAKLIESLPAGQRDAVLLRYFQQLSLDQIAERLQKSKSAVAGLLQRGLDSLRQKMVSSEE